MAPPINESIVRLIDEDEFTEKPSTFPQKRSIQLSHAALWTIVFLQAIIIVVQHSRARSTFKDPFYLYSPAEGAVKYELKTYNFSKESPFQSEPSPEVDRVWKELYSNGTSRVSRAVAARLPNKTAEIPGDPDGYYIAGIEVFHELHCLDMVRQALYPAYYPEMNMDDPRNHAHIRHCVNSIRQSLMCAADLHTIVWQWSEEDQDTMFRGDVVHKCKNWGLIAQWASDNVRTTDYNSHVHLDSDIQIPIYRSDGSSYFP